MKLFIMLRIPKNSNDIFKFSTIFEDQNTGRNFILQKKVQTRIKLHFYEL